MKPENTIKLLVGLLLVVFFVVLIRTAWVADDAFLTLRTVDNFVNGNRLNWNVGERVQVYTHPLWMMLMTIFYALIRDPLKSFYALTILVSAATVMLFTTRLAGVNFTGLFGLTILVFSKSFVDYSTSGLENPLTHLLLAVFLVLFLKSERDLDEKHILYLSLAAGLAAVNRLDTLLFFLPALAYSLVKARSKKAVLYAALGFLPLLTWEVFSIIYYGFPFPNTAYAKLNTGIAKSLLVQQGGYYFLDSLRRDPVTLPVIGFAILLAAKRFEGRKGMVALGVLLYLAYVVQIGGDFMSGRYFSAALLASAALLVTSLKPESNRRNLILLALVVVVGLAGPRTPLLSRVSDYEEERFHGITDERLVYYQATGLLTREPGSSLPDHAWVEGGLAHRAEGKLLVKGAINGMYAFYLGPQAQIVDTMGLGDALLARLPTTHQSEFFIGHFYRDVPEGYWKTYWSLGQGIKDPNLAAYYDKLSIVIRGGIFDPGRFTEIWRLNTGYYDHLLEAYVQAQGAGE